MAPPHQPQQLDQISQAIGALQANTKNIGESLNRHCGDDDRRHQENIERFQENKAQLDAIGASVAELTNMVRPLVSTVGWMRPIVQRVQITRWKLAGGIVVAFAVLAVVGWVIQAVAGKLIALALSALIGGARLP